LNKINVAIDGPAGAGKSAAARLVAESLHYVYVDTGAMYRAVAWKVLQAGLQTEQTKEIVELARRTELLLKSHPNGQQIFVDGQDVTDAIRSTMVNRTVSIIAAIPQIREILVKLQLQFAENKGIVMDGRDIGTHVLPDAEVKIFLTASVEARAARRYLEMVHPQITLEQLQQEMIERDRMDQQREASPLIQAADAYLLDSTHLTLNQVVSQILLLCNASIAGGT